MQRGNRTFAVLLALALVLTLGATCAAAEPAAPLTLLDMEAIALKESGLDADALVYAKAETTRQNAQAAYKIELCANGARFLCALSAEGTVLETRTQTVNERQSAGAALTLVQARDLALADAGVDAAGLLECEVDLDDDDGRLVYEIEFDQDKMEYEYKVDAITGKILEADKERRDEPFQKFL